MTETVETNKPDEQDGTFDRTYTEFKRLTTLISKNGVEKVGKGKESRLVTVPDGTKILLTPSMKDVYSYLYTFQSNENRTNYPEPIHPNMDVIAWENGISKPTAQKAVDDLMRAGVLIKDQIQVGSGFKSNSYIVLKPSKVVARGVTPPYPNASKYSATQGSGKDEQKTDAVEPNVVESTASTAGIGQSLSDIYSDQHDAVSDNHVVNYECEPAGENVVGIPWIANSFTSRGELVPEARRWAQSQGATTWEDEIKLVWELIGKTNMGEPGENMRPDDVPAPGPQKQQANGSEDQSPPQPEYGEYLESPEEEFDDSEIPF